MLVPVRDPNGECQSGNVGKERGAEVEVRVAIQRKGVQGLKYARNKTQASNMPGIRMLPRPQIQPPTGPNLMGAS